MLIKKINMIGLASALKPKIVLEVLNDMNALQEKEIEYLTNSDKGVVIDYCKTNNINVIKVDYADICISIETLKARNADLLICVGWNKKLPDIILGVYKKCINCHGGLLPDYRGNRAYMPLYANIPEEYGATIHYITNKFDDGSIIMQRKLKLYLEETPLIIHRRLCELTAFMLPESVRMVENEFEGIKQTGTARFFTSLRREEMDSLRHRNIENIRKGLPKEIAPHKAWKL